MTGELSASSRWPASCTGVRTSSQTPYSRCNATEKKSAENTKDDFNLMGGKLSITGQREHREHVQCEYVNKTRH